MTEQLKQFILKNKDLINQSTKETWQLLYNDIYKNQQFSGGEFTEILLEANIDPTIYLGYIPVGYLRNSSIKYYQIPKWVTKIEAYAFEDSQLKEMTIPQNILHIDSGAFQGCVNLKKVIFNNSLQKIPFWCFCGCKNLDFITFPSELKKIDYLAFSHVGLEDIIIPFGVEELNSCFYDSKSLKSITMPDTIQKISNDLFKDCSNLTTIYFKGSMIQAKRLGLHYKKYLGKCSVNQIICNDGIIEV